MAPPVRLEDFDFIWASPPCQHYTNVWLGRPEKRNDYPDLLGPVREMLIASGRPFCIENVPGAPMRADVVLTGAMFGLDIVRKRLFECSGFTPPFALLQEHFQKTVSNGDLATVAGQGANNAWNVRRKAGQEAEDRYPDQVAGPAPRSQAPAVRAEQCGRVAGRDGDRLDDARRAARGRPAGLLRAHRPRGDRANSPMKWSKGIVEWTEGDDAFLSVVFTWDLEDAWTRARWLHHSGYRVHVGGPGVFVRTPVKTALEEFAKVGGHLKDAVTRHNPNATFASRGCPVGCWFCTVPAMEGRAFTLIPDFTPRPILCDNNLSALPAEYQEHIIARYQTAGVPLLDANSGFEPRTFNEDVFQRWKPIMRGPWRFALDDAGDLPHVERVMAMLRGPVPNSRKKRVYVLIGNEPFEACMERIQIVLDQGCEPHCQPVMKLNALKKRPWVRHDWTERLLADVARWVNGRYWKYCAFTDYDRTMRTGRQQKGRPS